MKLLAFIFEQPSYIGITECFGIFYHLSESKCITLVLLVVDFFFYFGWLIGKGSFFKNM